MEEHYLMLLGLDNQKGLTADIINDAFVLKIELLGNLEGETAYVDDLKAGRAYLLETCNLKGALN